MQCLPPARCDRGAVSELLTVAGEYGEHGASTTAPLGSPAVGVLTLDRAGVLIAGLEEHGRDDDARRAADDGGAAAVVTLRRIAGRLAHPPDRPTPTPGHQRRGCHHPRREIPARNHGRHRFGRQRIRLDQTGVRRREVKLTQTFSSQYKDTHLLARCPSPIAPTVQPATPGKYACMKRWLTPPNSNGAFASLLCASGMAFLGWYRGKYCPQPASSLSVIAHGWQAYAFTGAGLTSRAAIMSIAGASCRSGRLCDWVGVTTDGGTESRWPRPRRGSRPAAAIVAASDRGPTRHRAASLSSCLPPAGSRAGWRPLASGSRSAE
jgi:hypothetical protein